MSAASFVILRPPTFTLGVDNAARQWKQRASGMDCSGGVEER